MRILFDHNVPLPLRHLPPAYDIVAAAERGWGELTNRRLLATAEQEGCDVFITADRNLVFQQNLAARTLGIVVLSTQQLASLTDGLQMISDAIEQAAPGKFVLVDLPRSPLPRPPLLRRPAPNRDP